MNGGEDKNIVYKYKLYVKNYELNRSMLLELKKLEEEFQNVRVNIYYKFLSNNNKKIRVVIISSKVFVRMLNIIYDLNSKELKISGKTRQDVFKRIYDLMKLDKYEVTVGE